MIYMEKLDLLLWWEQDSNGVKLYNIHGELVRSIDLRPELHSTEVKSLAMMYSELEDRVGVLNNDYTISFWDVNDDFKFEKIIRPLSDELLSQIYYINHIGSWLTIDQKSQIFFMGYWRRKSRYASTKTSRNGSWCLRNNTSKDGSIFDSYAST